MFWKRKETDQKEAKLSGPVNLAEPVKKSLASDPNIDPAILAFLKSVVKPGEKGPRVFDIRVFDPSEAEAQDIKVQDYNTLTENPGLIIAEGVLDEASKKAELKLKKDNLKIKFLSYDEILQQIEELKESGSSVFFYTNAGAGIGGPLGRGAALIRRNGPDKKQRKYSVFAVNIVDMQPTEKENKIFDSDKADQIAKWVAESHKPRAW
jgi:hypothetical protein